MKEFFDGSIPKDIFQAKLNSMMEKSNSDNPMGMKWKTQKKLVVDRRDEKHYMQKQKTKKKPRKIGIHNGLWICFIGEAKNRHANCSWGRDHNSDTDTQMAKRGQGMILLLFQQCGVSFRKQAFSLPAVSPGWRLRKMQSITMAKGRTMEEPGSCFLVQMKSGAVTSTWVDTSARTVGMVA